MKTNYLIVLLSVLLSISSFLSGCASMDVKDMSQKSVSDISSLAGVWTGSLSGGTYLKLTIAPDGNWKNVVKGKTYVGKATIKDDQIFSESYTTGIKYYWKLYEDKDQRIIVWTDINSGKVIAKSKFSSSN